jgi:hypothetical protein
MGNIKTVFRLDRFQNVVPIFKGSEIPEHLNKCLDDRYEKHDMKLVDDNHLSERWICYNSNCVHHVEVQK